nr:hypothetical protein [uncultured Pseudomonas sp.]
MHNGKRHENHLRRWRDSRQEKQELRKFIERMKQSRDEVSIAYNDGLLEGRLIELKDLGVLSADDVVAMETEAASGS